MGKAKKRKCSELQPSEAVVFKRPSDIYKRKIEDWGNVDYVDKERHVVSITYLEGYKSRNYDCPFEDMLAVYNPDGERMKFGSISGYSDYLLPE